MPQAVQGLLSTERELTGFYTYRRRPAAQYTGTFSFIQQNLGLGKHTVKFRVVAMWP